MEKLFGYQRTGAEWLAQRNRALLADAPGLGKSAQAIRGCDLIGSRLTVGVVCPASLRQNWHREFDKFSSAGHVILVESFERVARGAFTGIQFDVLIIDEAHYLKNPDAKRTRAVYGKNADGSGLVSQSERVYLLTGTPQPNHPGELYSHMRELWPDTIVSTRTKKPSSYGSFVRRYCHVYDNGFGTQIGGARQERLPDLKARLDTFMLRRLKSEVLPDLPPIRFDTLALDGSYTDTAETQIVRQAIDQDKLESVATSVSSLRKETGLAKLPAIKAWIRNFLESTEEKLVVFAYHVDLLSELSYEFKDCSTMVRGDTPTGVRQERVDKFQRMPSCRLFFGQIQAAGVGLTLTAASTVLMVESSWVPAENAQAAMRVHRIGQENGCLVLYAMLAGSIDEDIQKALARKSADIVQVFGEV